VTTQKQIMRSICTATLLLVGLTGCVVNDPFTGGPTGGIDFKRDNYARAEAIRKWRSCRDSAVALDSQARKSGDVAKYRASAKLLAKCEAELGPEAASAAQDERFRAYAISVQNNLKAGDIAAAREGLSKLRQGFPDKDLYLADGASFIESIEVLTGKTSRESVNDFPMRNVSRELKKELRRIRYWKNH
tara:strand:+ start:2239 stop:2805 length:567 start_codon:yes stop_codon:yes gene_type:complete